MKRWRASVVAGLGCVGSARAEELPWRAATPTRTPAPFAAMPAAPAPAGGAWQPARFLSLDAPRPAEGRPLADAFGPAARPLLPEPVPAAPATPSIIPLPATHSVDFAAPAPVSFSTLFLALDFPALPPPVISAEPTPAPAVSAQLPKIDVPPVAPPPEPIVPPRRAEEAPAPRPAPQALPGPRPTPGSAPLAPIDTPGNDPLPPKVWGTHAGHEFPAHGTAYPTDDVLTAGATAPASRHGAWGSRDLTLSRDHHFLDLFDRGGLSGGDPIVLGDGGMLPPRSFVEAEYLLWWVQRANVPVLATTGTGASTGYLGQPGTQSLLGPGGFGSTARNGFRVRAGTWWGGPPECGIDASLFVLGDQNSRAEFDSSRFPIIARPFFSANLNTEFAELVAFPGLSTGRLVIENESSLWGADINFKRALCRTCDSYRGWFAGFRYLDLSETLAATEFITAEPDAARLAALSVVGATPPDPAGTRIVVNDTFRTENRFYGAQVGYTAGRQRGRWSFDARASVALGVTEQELEITGSQVRQRPGEAPQIFTTGGLLAAQSNIGTFTSSAFTVVPELTFNLGYQMSERWKATVGYNFLLWSNVARPGDQIDRVLDFAFVPNSPNVPFSGQARPAPEIKDTSMVIQGVQFGLQYQW